MGVSERWDEDFEIKKLGKRNRIDKRLKNYYNKRTKEQFQQPCISRQMTEAERSKYLDN